MPTFRLTTTDGQTSTVTAARAVLSTDELRFQIRHGGAWTQVACAPLTDLASVERRLTEYDGRRRYVADRELTAALAERRGLAAGVPA